MRSCQSVTILWLPLVLLPSLSIAFQFYLMIKKHLKGIRPVIKDASKGLTFDQSLPLGASVFLNEMEFSFEWIRMLHPLISEVLFIRILDLSQIREKIYRIMHTECIKLKLMGPFFVFSLS